jgi:hypothetical protein
MELVALVAIGVVPLPEAIPRAILLLAVASLARWVRGKSWAELVRGPSAFAGIGAVACAAALVLAVVIGTPAIEALTGRGVEWSQHPIVRGSGQQLFAMATLVGFSALASELALRGWVVERVLELGGGKEMAVMIGGFAEMIVTDGEFAARLGAGCFGFALGWMYVAAGRSVVAPVCARVAFVLGALLLEALRLVT